MKYKLRVYQILEYGQRKDALGNPHQEDSMFPQMGDASTDDRLFIVCDGMGGHDAGEVASATVCEAMSQSILTQQPDPEGNFTIDMLKKAINDAFDALDTRDTGAEKKMGTTMTMLKLHDHGAMIAHMGDSRVYHIRPGQDSVSTHILHETWDHSLVNDLVKIGELTPEEARTSRQRNVITRAMQPHINPRPKADVYETVDIKPGDIFYLCTDGMLENMEDEQIKFNFSHEAGDTEHKRSSLISATQLNRDNHTAIIVEILDVIDPLPIPEVVEPIAPVATISEPDTPTSTPRAPHTQATKPAAAPREPKSSNNAMVAVIIALSVALIIVLIFLVRSYASKGDDREEASSTSTSEMSSPRSSAAENSASEVSVSVTSDTESTSPDQLADEMKEVFSPSGSNEVEVQGASVLQNREQTSPTSTESSNSNQQSSSTSSVFDKVPGAKP